MKINIKKEWFFAFILLIILTVILLLNEEAPILSSKTQEEISEDLEEMSKTIEVYINGAVVSPGVYTLNQGDRLKALLNKAGGFLESAEEKNVNLARVVEDGEMVWIYEKLKGQVQYIGVDFFNYESKENLMTLDGVGATTAEKIINYRKDVGLFKSYEDLLNIEGIGDEKLKSMMKQLAP